jgi:hypothetical protein
VLAFHADVVLDHQAAQGLAVDQDNPGRDPVGVCDSFRRETAAGDEDAAVCLGSVQHRPPG